MGRLKAGGVTVEVCLGFVERSGCTYFAARITISINGGSGFLLFMFGFSYRVGVVIL